MIPCKYKASNRLRKLRAKLEKAKVFDLEIFAKNKRRRRTRRKRRGESG